jgi:type IV secretory pathway VirB2 component (pilin)
MPRYLTVRAHLYRLRRPPVRSMIGVAVCAALVLLPAIAGAQPSGGTSPWERVATSFREVFVGPIAKGFSIFALVVCGLSVATMEAGAKRTIAGVIFGVAMAVLAVNFLQWLTGVTG